MQKFLPLSQEPSYGYQLSTTALPKGRHIMDDCLFIKQSSNFVRVRIDDITFLESDRVYLTVYTTTGKYLVRNTLQHYIDIIASRHFIRVHRSYVVNTQHLNAICPDGLMVNGHTVPIGKVYKDELLELLKLG